MFADCYKGKRVFLTGHTGFKGSWLSAWLTSLGATVCGFADTVPTEPSHFKAMGLDGHMRDLRGDIRDRDAVVRAMCEFRPDVVFHLAAQALVRKSYEVPAATFEANVMGTLNVLEAMRACPSVQAGVFITSISGGSDRCGIRPTVADSDCTDMVSEIGALIIEQRMKQHTGDVA